MRLVKPILIIAIVVGGVVLSPRIGDPRRWFNEPAGATAPAPAPCRPCRCRSPPS